MTSFKSVDLQLPTVAEMRQLPERAILALAVRCVRRAQPLYSRARGIADHRKHKEAIQTALVQAEQYCRGHQQQKLLTFAEDTEDAETTDALNCAYEAAQDAEDNAEWNTCEDRPFAGDMRAYAACDRAQSALHAAAAVSLIASAAFGDAALLADAIAATGRAGSIARAKAEAARAAALAAKTSNDSHEALFLGILAEGQQDAVDSTDFIAQDERDKTQIALETAYDLAAEASETATRLAAEAAEAAETTSIAIASATEFADDVLEPDDLYNAKEYCLLADAIEAVTEAADTIENATERAVEAADDAASNMYDDFAIVASASDVVARTVDIVADSATRVAGLAPMFVYVAAAAAARFSVEAIQSEASAARVIADSLTLSESPKSDVARLTAADAETAVKIATTAIREDLARLVSLNLGGFGQLGQRVDPRPDGPIGPLWPSRPPQWFK